MPKPIEEKEEDISDDPFVSAVNKDLERVGSRNDNVLLIILLALVPLVYAYEHSMLKSNWVALAFIMFVVALIAYTIFNVVNGKRKVAVKYGLVCRACGYRPEVRLILLAADLKKCRKCGHRLMANKSFQG